MTSLGIFCLFFGYTLIFAGVKGVNVWDEVLAGFGGPDPIPIGQQVSEQAAKEAPLRETARELMGKPLGEQIRIWADYIRNTASATG